MDYRIEQLVFNDVAKRLQNQLKTPMTIPECKSLVDKYTTDSVKNHNLNLSLSTELGKKFFDNFIEFDRYISKSSNPLERLKYNSKYKEYFTFRIKVMLLNNYSKLQQQQQKQEKKVDVSGIAKTVISNDLGREEDLNNVQD